MLSCSISRRGQALHLRRTAESQALKHPVPGTSKGSVTPPRRHPCTPQPRGTALSLAGQGQGGTPAPRAEGLEEMGSHRPSRGSPRQGWAAPMGAKAAGESVVLLDLPGALGLRHGQGGAPHGAVGVVGALSSPTARSRERGTGGGGQNLVGKSCPFPRSLRKRWAKAGSAPGGCPVETWEKEGVRLGLGWPQRGPRCWPETGPEGGRKPGNGQRGRLAWVLPPKL